jgi:hypothetical protein
VHTERVKGSVLDMLEALFAVAVAGILRAADQGDSTVRVVQPVAYPFSIMPPTMSAHENDCTYPD